MKSTRSVGVRSTPVIQTRHAHSLTMIGPKHAGKKAGRPALQLKEDAITALFGIPQPSAAKVLGVSVSGLKKQCRKFGILHWPYKRRSCSLNDRSGIHKTDRACTSGPKTASVTSPQHTTFCNTAGYAGPQQDLLDHQLWTADHAQTALRSSYMGSAIVHEQDALLKQPGLGVPDKPGGHIPEVEQVRGLQPQTVFSTQNHDVASLCRTLPLHTVRPFFNSTFQGDDALCAEFSRGQGVSVSDQPSTVATSMYPRPQPFTDVRNLCADGWLVDSSELGYFANPSDSVRIRRILSSRL